MWVTHEEGGFEEVARRFGCVGGEEGGKLWWVDGWWDGKRRCAARIAPRRIGKE
jgi:hypothetical protein